MVGVEIDVPGRTRLDDPALVHHRNDIGQGQGFDPVMGHIDSRDLKLGQKGPQFLAGFFPKFRVQVGKRLIKEDDLGFGDQSTGQGHTLLLPAGKFSCRPILEPLHLHEAQRFFDLVSDDVLGHFSGLERIGHVVENVHVRPDGVGLKDHAQAPVLRGNEDVLLTGPDDLTAYFDFPGVRGLQTNDAT